MKFVEQKPGTLSDSEIDAGIEWCATRVPVQAGNLRNLRAEKLRRQFEHKLAEAIKADKFLDGVSTVTLS